MAEKRDALATTIAVIALIVALAAVYYATAYQNKATVFAPTLSTTSVGGTPVSTKICVTDSRFCDGISGENVLKDYVTCPEGKTLRVMGQHYDQEAGGPIKCQGGQSGPNGPGNYCYFEYVCK